jgi:hypothetical protein
MAYEQRDMSGSMFINSRKEKETQPDRQGACMIDGVQYWISGWVKEGQNGKWMSLAFKRKEIQPAVPTDTPSPNYDEDVPF